MHSTIQTEKYNLQKYAKCLLDFQMLFVFQILS